jgi:hypothetical protein
MKTVPLQKSWESFFRGDVCWITPGRFKGAALERGRIVEMDRDPNQLKDHHGPFFLSYIMPV